MAIRELSREEARTFLVAHHGLHQYQPTTGAAGVIALLSKLRCIQLDPLDMIGTNADLVALARVDGIVRGDVYRFLYPGYAFEHFAKERCLLPPHHFPWYRAQAAETPWWRLSERKKRVKASILDAVLAEITAHGPTTAKQLTQHGKVLPMNWNGWKGTSSATSMALEVLWTQCKIVVCGRRAGAKIYDIPERALAKHFAGPGGNFADWALRERVEAAGLLSRNSGPHWSMLSTVRTSALPDALVADGSLEEVRVEGFARRYLAPRGFSERLFESTDDRMRILGPLDPLIWDRELLRNVFGFDYVWEVYKPAAKRRWGWYVCPLLHRGHFVGRLEASIVNDTLKVSRVWIETTHKLDEEALAATLQRHALACGVERWQLPKRRLIS